MVVVRRCWNFGTRLRGAAGVVRGELSEAGNPVFQISRAGPGLAVALAAVGARVVTDEQRLSVRPGRGDEYLGQIC